VAWPSNIPPSNWLICDGSEVSRETYASLWFALTNNGRVESAYGDGDGTTTFNLPDLRGRVAVGRSGIGALSILGATGGSSSHSHTLSNDGYAKIRIAPGNLTILSENLTGLPAWTSTANNSFSGTSGSGTGTSTNATGLGGTTDLDSSLQPYQVINYIIKYSEASTPGDSVLATRVGVLETATATTNRSGLVPITDGTLTIAGASSSGSQNSFGTVSFTDATSLTFDNIFTSKYLNYKVVVDPVISTTGNMTSRFRIGGTTTTTSNYAWGFVGISLGSSNISSAINDTSMVTAPTLLASAVSPVILDIFSPVSASTRTQIVGQNARARDVYNVAAGSQVPAAADGIVFTFSAATSGNITIYGYRQ
jgi:microcystin-dependent protein